MAEPSDPHDDAPANAGDLARAAPERHRAGPDAKAAPGDLAAIADLGRGRRLLGFDLGTKTIGLALSDVERRIATPFETIARTKFSKEVEQIAAIVARYEVGGFLLGLPVNMDGSEGTRCQSTRSFARNLVARLPMPLAYWDERLSTAAVTRAMIAADTSRARRAKMVDSAAAAYILQGAIDRLSAQSRMSEIYG